MKKVFSSILLIFLLPFKLLKNNKVKKTNKFIQANNNFFMGLLLGALLSLVVNIASVQIQNVIEKQRVLEALENEILSNTLQAKRIMEYNIEELEKNKGINTFHTFSKYNNDIWTQSIDSAKWISQLDSKVQTEISGYYTIILPGHNSLIEKLISLSEIYNRECAFYSGNMFDQVSIELNKQQRCNTLYYQLLRFESQDATSVAEYGFSLLNNFHPTQDRLNNFTLKLLMGNQSIRILSGV